MKIDRAWRAGLLSAAVIAVMELGAATALAGPASGDGCQALFQRGNRDYCRAQLAQSQWPCTALPVQDLQDLKTCVQVFDFNSFPSAAAGSQPRAPVDLKAMTPPPVAPERRVAAPAPAQEQTGEVLPLKMTDVAPGASGAVPPQPRRVRAVVQEPDSVATPPVADPQIPPPAETVAPQTEAPAAPAIAPEVTQPARGPGARMALGATLLGVGGLILTALIGALLFWRVRRGAGRGRVDAAGAYRDCTLEGGEGPALLLAGALLPESAGGIVVGRHTAQAQVIIDRPEISRRHARFAVRDGALAIEDLGSANGTSVDGTPVRAGERRIVRHGARIQFGPLTYTLRVAS